MRSDLKNAIKQAPKAVQPDGKLALVIFDCDGVLVDSERFSAIVLGNEARKHGWDISDQETEERFTGIQLVDIKKEFEKHALKPFPDNWVQTTQDKIVDIMKKHVEPVKDVEFMLETIKQLGVPFRVGSNSSMAEMDTKFAKTGLNRWLQRERLHSGHDVKHPKPFPDLYLYAAEQENVAPENCMVVEDSDVGLKAAYDAGMACVLLRNLDKKAPDYPGLLRVENLKEVTALIQYILQSQK